MIEILLIWPGNGFTVSFYLQTISESRAKERESERKKELRHAEREKEEKSWTQKPTPTPTPTNPKTDSDSDEPRNRLRLTQKTQDRENPFVKPIRSHPENPFNQTQKTHLSNPENPFDRTISDLHRADHTTGKIVAPQHRSTQNRSFSCYFCWVLRIWVLFLLGFDEFGFCPWPTFVVLDPNSSSPTQLRCPHSSNPVAFLSLSLSIWPDLMNFFCCDLFLLCLFTKKWY